jgi:peptide/nickel transport system substrate-binding protein
VMRNAQGQPLTFEILLNQGATETQQIVDIFAGALRRLGVQPRITTVDSAQYNERTQEFDFDMAYYIRALSLSPGNEQRLYWGSAAANQPGSRNWMGAASPAIDAMIDEMLSAESRTDFVAAVRALDRILTASRFVIPIWYRPESYLAHSSKLSFPDGLPAYGDWIGFQPDVWWVED